jgi:hypothetical protein
MYIRKYRNTRKDKFEIHKNGYPKFCESVVHQRLLVNQEILLLSRLTQLVITSIQNVEGVEPVGIRL